MSKRKHTEAQMIEALKSEAGRSADEFGRSYGVSKHTVYALRDESSNTSWFANL